MPKVLGEARGTSASLDAVALGAAAAACRAGAAWQGALHLLEAGREVRGAASYNVVAGACAAASRWRLSLLLLDASPHGGDLVGHNAAITAMDRASRWAVCLELFGRMPQRRIDPDAVSFGAAASSCGSASRWQAVVWLVEEARRPLGVTATRRFPRSTRGAPCFRGLVWVSCRARRSACGGFAFRSLEHCSYGRRSTPLCGRSYAFAGSCSSQDVVLSLKALGSAISSGVLPSAGPVLEPCRVD